nr:tRNA (adenosine(37)-N6)-threonylcarbamoyltransferase complex ATPase subunit type 1 TsaE [Thiocystis violacea]
MEIDLDSPEAQQAFGVQLASAMQPPCVLYLEGDLGTGKTTLTRGILRGLGHVGAARSPTYTLIEPYTLIESDALADVSLYHLDLYRLGDPEELEYLGLRDLMTQDALWVVEWPERGAGFLPKADLLIQINYHTAGRHLNVIARTGRGEAVLSWIRDHPS